MGDAEVQPIVAASAASQGSRWVHRSIAAAGRVTVVTTASGRAADDLRWIQWQLRCGSNGELAFEADAESMRHSRAGEDYRARWYEPYRQRSLKSTRHGHRAGQRERCNIVSVKDEVSTHWQMARLWATEPGLRAGACGRWCLPRWQVGGGVGGPTRTWHASAALQAGWRRRIVSAPTVGGEYQRGVRRARHAVQQTRR
jgi:hypothetical protein